MGDRWPPIADPVARIVVLFRGGTTIRALTDMFGLPDQVVEGIIRLAARLAQAEQRITEMEDGVEALERERVAAAGESMCQCVDVTPGEAIRATDKARAMLAERNRIRDRINSRYERIRAEHGGDVGYWEGYLDALDTVVSRDVEDQQ